MIKDGIKYYKDIIDSVYELFKDTGIKKSDLVVLPLNDLVSCTNLVDVHKNLFIDWLIGDNYGVTLYAHRPNRKPTIKEGDSPTFFMYEYYIDDEGDILVVDGNLPSMTYEDITLHVDKCGLLETIGEKL